MTQQHTPGPWVIGNRYTMQGVYTDSGDLVRAAAPDLLEALEAARDSLWFAIVELKVRGCVPVEDIELMDARLKSVDAAIAKAKGTVV